MQAAIKKLAQSLGIIFLLFAAGLLLIFIWMQSKPTQEVALLSDTSTNASPIKNGVNASLDPMVILGYELLVNTSLHIGPGVSDPQMRFTANKLECISCHLNEGTKAFGIPLNSVVARFPQYRGREDKIGSIEERINGCLSRSMNGRPMQVDQKEMQAFVAYLTWLSDFESEEMLLASATEKGLKAFDWPDRAADLKHGKAVYVQHCALCHRLGGEGKFDSQSAQFLYPPLWGKDAYNNGAGMTRLLTAASFIKYNMPFGVSHEAPLLTDAEAYDVAAYINQQQRPEKSDLASDFPDKLKKPLSTPYPPYADPFPVSQHQLGPYFPMQSYYEKEYGILKTK
ncbi:MAG: c-type cytochrome [Flavobacteriia bacterium]|nr:c-type cytochrome [Flavobacteriia bacterium]